MKDKTSVSHDEVMVKKLRENRTFAVEYLKAAMEDTEEPLRREAIRGSPRLSQSPKRWA
jgi:DNA-binding phage protein